MSDARLRELERRYQGSGTVADHAALLRARWHAGALTEDKLVLAAYARSDAARLALGHEPTERPGDPQQWVKKLKFLLDHPAELLIAAARLTAWLSVEWVRSQRFALYQPADRVEAHTEQALEILRQAWEFPTAAQREALEPFLPLWPSAPGPQVDPLTALDELFDEIENPFEGPFADLMPDRILEVFRAATDALFPPLGTTGVSRAADAASVAAAIVDPAALRRSFERAVREWALGIARPDPKALVG